MLLWMVAGAFLSATPAQAWGKKHREQTPPRDLPGHVEFLARKLWGVPLDESEPLTGEIQKLVTGHLEQWVPQAAAGNPDQGRLMVEVRRELDGVFSKLQYPLYERTAVFVEPWRNATLIGAGYTLGWSDTARVSAVALFERSEGKARLAAVTNFLPRCDLHYAFLPAPTSADFWLLIYGTRLGKSHPRLSAELDSFDGSALRPLWKTVDVYDGRLDVEPGRVVIHYMREDEFIEAATYGRRPPRREAVYRITPQGLEPVTDQEIGK